MIEAGVDGLMRVPFNKELHGFVIPQGANPVKGNAIGRRTKYYNPTTNEIYIETALFYNGGLDYPLGTLRVAGKKIK